MLAHPCETCHLDLLLLVASPSRRYDQLESYIDVQLYIVEPKLVLLSKFEPLVPPQTQQTLTWVSKFASRAIT